MDIRTIVVDNTVELKEKLTKLLNEIPGVTVCQSFDDAVAAMQYVEEHPVDLVFSDVVMPEISGITLASSIYALPEHPCFCPAFPDFLWKPGRCRRSASS